MDGNIPVLFVEGESLAEAWEKSVLSVYNNGCDIKTEYDKPEDPPSKDCSMTIVVKNPLAEPMIHRDFPGGFSELQEYVLEVLDGIKDHLVRKSAEDSSDTRWEYTYHQRLFEYAIPGMEDIYDQIELMSKKLADTPHSRRAQAITWKVWEDNFCNDPACLQSIWCRLLQGENEDQWYLNSNIRFRSNDAYKAAFMNMFAFIQLQLKIADSYHIYGSYFNEFKDRFIKAIENRSFEERTYRYTDMKILMDEAIPDILEKSSKIE